MSTWLIVVMMVVGGALMAFQGPINAALRTHVGIYESSLISFVVGTAALILIVSLKGQGNLLAARHAPWWHWLGGLIGVVFVTVSLLAVPRIGDQVQLGAYGGPYEWRRVTDVTWRHNSDVRGGVSVIISLDTQPLAAGERSKNDKTKAK